MKTVSLRIWHMQGGVRTSNAIALNRLCQGLQSDWLPRRRPHQSLASVGVAALVRLVVAAGDRMSGSVWVEAITTLHDCAADTRPVSWPTPPLHPQGASQELFCWCSAGVLKLQAGRRPSWSLGARTLL